MPKKAIVIGGGIGGLTTAIALRKSGIAVNVYEKVSEIREVGAGLSLWTNAVKALYKLGLRSAIDPLGVPNTSGGIFSAKGQQLTHLSNQELEKRFGTIGLVVHRAELLTALYNQLPEGTVQLGVELTGFEQNENGVTVQLSDNSQIQADLLIGADGIHSKVREQLFGDSPLRYSGYTAWRGVVSYEQATPTASETWGKGARFGIVPMSQNRVYWFATHNQPAGQPSGLNATKAELLDIFGNWHKPIREILETTPSEAILHNDIYDRLPLSSWTKGRVTLLGDAAHPMTPNLGQGACQAIEDAVVLADYLSKESNIVAALKQYEAARISRTSEIVNRSWKIGQLGQLQNPLICAVRNALVRLTPSSVQLKQLEPIVGFEV